AIGQCAAIVVNGHIRFHPHQKPVAIKDGFLLALCAELLDVFLGEFGLGFAVGRGGLDERDYVVNDLAVARPGFGELDIFVLGELRRDFKVLVLVRPGGAESELLGHLKNDIRLAYGPPVDIRGRGWQVFGIAFGRSAFDPCAYGIDLLLAEAPVIGPLAVMGISVPGRHFTADDLFANGARPWASVLVAEERHRGGFAGPMATRAVPEENRCNITAERY